MSKLIFTLVPSGFSADTAVVLPIPTAVAVVLTEGSELRLVKETLAMVEGNDGVTVMLLSTVRVSLALESLKGPNISLGGDTLDVSEPAEDENADETEDPEDIAVLGPKPDGVARVPPKVDSTSLKFEGAVLLEINSVWLAFSEVIGTSSETGLVVKAASGVDRWVLDESVELWTGWDSLEKPSAFEEETEVIWLMGVDESRPEVLRESSKDVLIEEKNAPEVGSVGIGLVGSNAVNESEVSGLEIVGMILESPLEIVVGVVLIPIEPTDESDRIKLLGARSVEDLKMSDSEINVVLELLRVVLSGVSPTFVDLVDEVSIEESEFDRDKLVDTSKVDILEASVDPLGL